MVFKRKTRSTTAATSATEDVPTLHVEVARLNKHRKLRTIDQQPLVQQDVQQQPQQQQHREYQQLESPEQEAHASKIQDAVVMERIPCNDVGLKTEVDSLRATVQKLTSELQEL